MRVLTQTQGTEEWEMARKGRVTASSIDKVLAGKHTKGRAEYMMNLILDLEGIADFRDDAPWFEAGKKYESYALGWYQVQADVDVERVGFVLHDEYNWFGCSPDGLIRPEGGVEIKYRSTLETFHDACIKPISRAYEYQMQACMAVCNARWWDYMNYWRDDYGQREQGHIRRIVRDDAKIRELESAAMTFWRDTVRTYRQRTKKDFITYPFDKWQRARAVPRGTETSK